MIGSQAYTREFVKPPSKLKGAQKAAAYKWLSRGLEEAMLAFISQADSRRYALRAAVYEFDWTPVSEALKKALGACDDKYRGKVSSYYDRGGAGYSDRI